ncbi:glycosyl hydrolases family 31-domain-containing protein [Daldinia decipiens]|uniref:glycosyl hydrolases family 31-domain-containing protein n=1 Tax=Daldinia decipiens TaxID=326647 RepID=UPI0020C2E4D7|nr:glycosyl hydrolases family 31-domain-containing protein [Daldinia decipiens]KAI1662704.1 glycosyl hydrolases family 31-domain-containing protein [Daldinia decipiens]
MSTLEYNIIGGVLDFYFLAGSSPSEVSRQYAEVVGLPAMMSYWTFGFHQCKYGYCDVNYAVEVVASYSTANIPLETLWGDIDYMDLRQVSTEFPERFPLHKIGEDKSAFLQADDGSNYRGVYWVGEVVVESVVVLGGKKPVTLKGPWSLDGPFEVAFQS